MANALMFFLLSVFCEETQRINFKFIDFIEPTDTSIASAAATVGMFGANRRRNRSQHAGAATQAIPSNNSYRRY
jgi:hypothetical protein